MPLVQNYFSPFLSPPSLHLNALSFREHGSHMEGDTEASTNICCMNEEKVNYTNKECQPLNASLFPGVLTLSNRKLEFQALLTKSRISGQPN